MEKDIVAPGMLVIGGSAGSLQVILYILSHLKPGFNIPVVVVVHRAPDGESALAEVLSHATKLDVKEAEDKEPILPGTVYLAPADYHLLIEKNRSLSLDGSEKIQFSRPSIDITFQTAADAYGKSLIGVLLSGANSDGTDGFADIRRAGGTLIVQDPKKAQAGYMPQNAIDQGLADFVLDRKGIAEQINRLVNL